LENLFASLELKIEAVRSCRYFATLSDEILEEIASGVSLVRYQRGEVILWQDEPCSGLYILKQGSVKLFKLSPQGRELILRVFEEGTTFNEVPVFDGGLNPIHVAALEDCEIWVVAPSVIREAMFKHPELSKALVLNLCQNLRQLVGMIEELSFYQVTHRLARLIAQIPREQLSGTNANRLTQDQLAARLGTVREVVARSLRELERSGAIRVSHRQIRIIDEAILQQWIQGPHTD
jgi:CRP/FNR family transcriptional regulator